MKGFAKLALSIALLAIVVLSIVVASVAWFTSNPEVNANDITLGSAKTLYVTFGDQVSGETQYEGQKGNAATGDDAPYVYAGSGFHVRIDSLSGTNKRGTIKVEFGTVTITTCIPDPTSPGSPVRFEDVLITDLFHITATIKEDGENKPTYPVTIRDDGYIGEVVDAPQGSYPISSDEVALFGEGGYSLSFTYTFLPEAAYQLWTAGSYNSIVGYELKDDGAYIGVVSYTAYNAKYHYDLQRYTKSQTADGNGNYTYNENAEGDYVRVVTSHQPYASVTKYSNASGTTQNANGSYIKVGDSNDYVNYKRYNPVPGFPYSDDKYRGETFSFKINCSVEEVTYETHE